MDNQEKTLSGILLLVEQQVDIDVIWLYGSRAKGNFEKTSDFDLAVAFNSKKISNKSIDYYADELAEVWSEKVNEQISLVDINKIPVPLATMIINEGKVLLCKNDLRLHSEMQRIWSLWEQYRYEHKKYRK